MTVRKPSDVSDASWKSMLEIAPKGSKLVGLKPSRFSYEMIFDMIGEPSAESGLKQGDRFVTSVPKKLQVSFR